MTFAELLYFMLGMVKAAHKMRLHVFPTGGERGLQMTQQAFSKARQKIKWEALGQHRLN